MNSVNPLPKWAMHRYAQLWRKFGSKEFTYEQASKVLGESDNLVSVTLSYLKKYNWLAIKLHPLDSRKRIYQVTNPEVAVKGMLLALK